MRKHFSDVLSAVLVVGALFLLAQPDSQARTLWRNFRQDRAALRTIARSWESLSEASTPLWPGRGSPQLIEVSDYECPFCRRVNAVVDSVVASGVRVAYLHYPVPSHPQAKLAALAAICAKQAGQFLLLHNYFMRDSTWRTGSAWEEHATRAGVSNAPAVAACMGSVDAADRLRHEMSLADTVVITGTPTFLSRTGLHRGVATFEQLLRLAESDR